MKYPDDDGAEPVVLGLRGGVVIVDVTPVRGYTFAQSTTGPTLWTPVIDFEGASGGSAVVMRGNEVVQLLGRALWVIESHGAVTVTGNTLENFGNQEVVGLTQFYTLSWTDGTTSVTRQMAGACVEIFGYSKALDVAWEPEQIADIPVPQWVDAAGTLEDGGNTLMIGNVIRLTWNNVGGISTAVLISTLASAVFDNNDVFVDMSSAYGSPTPMAEFYDAIMANPQQYSFVISSAYVAGYSTGQANGNRVTEGKFDALFSLTVGTVVRPGGNEITDVINAVSATANVLSHAVVRIDEVDISDCIIVMASNAVIYPDISVPGYEVQGATPGSGRAIVIKTQ